MIRERLGHSFKMRVHEVALDIKADDPRIIEIIRDGFQPMRSIKKPIVSYSITIRTAGYALVKVPGRLKSKGKNKFFTFYYDKKKSELWWKWSGLRVIGCMHQASGQAELWIDNLNRRFLFSLAQAVIFYPLQYLTRPLGWQFIHSAAIVKNGKAALIVGPSMAGKTSLSLAFLKRGYQIMSDDTNILCFKNGHVELKSFPRLIQARKQSFHYLPKLRGHQKKSNLSAGDRWVFKAEDVASNAFCGSARPGLIASLQYRPRCRERLAPCVNTTRYLPLRVIQSSLMFYPEESYALEFILLIKTLLARTRLFHGIYSRGNFQKFCDRLELEINALGA